MAREHQLWDESITYGVGESLMGGGHRLWGGNAAYRMRTLSTGRENHLWGESIIYGVRALLRDGGQQRGDVGSVGGARRGQWGAEVGGPRGGHCGVEVGGNEMRWDWTGRHGIGQYWMGRHGIGRDRMGRHGIG